MTPTPSLASPNKQNENLTKIRNTEFLRNMWWIALASLERARKANMPSLDDRLAIYRALNESGSTPLNRSVSATKYLACDARASARGVYRELIVRRARRRIRIAARRFGSLARIRPITTIPLPNKSKETASVDCRSAHHAEHADSTANRAGRCSGALGVGIKHAGRVHRSRKSALRPPDAKHLIVN